MKYNFECRLKTTELQVRNILAAGIMNSISASSLARLFKVDTDDQDYYTLDCNLNFTYENDRDIVFRYVSEYKDNNTSVSGYISTHLCVHDEQGLCCASIIVGDIDGDIGGGIGV